jgi:hypothetical protein
MNLYAEFRLHIKLDLLAESDDFSPRRATTIHKHQRLFVVNACTPQ